MELKFRICKEDLFLKNFIVNLFAPSNYIGPNGVVWYSDGLR